MRSVLIPALCFSRPLIAIPAALLIPESPFYARLVLPFVPGVYGSFQVLSDQKHLYSHVLLPFVYGLCLNRNLIAENCLSYLRHTMLVVSILSFAPVFPTSNMTTVRASRLKILA